ncbi:MAG: LysM peptidoglycan-binding domain-containing protein [Anaerolineae bacterium]|nr:MAG: LysM peptidoglycan-binding domain-containing protein [Anaerolineae bacterium]
MRLKPSLIAVLVVASLVTPAAAPVAPHQLPASAYISGVVGHKQTLPLSCESRSAADLAAFWGISINETTFHGALPKSDNPEKGFVGDVYGTWGQIPPNPYGVHARPVAKLLRQYGLNAEARLGMSWKDLRTEISEGRPVIVWVVGAVWSGTPVSYTASDGQTTTVAAYEHTMILIGYDENYVYLIDSGSGNNQTHSIDNFRASWLVLGNMAVVTVGNGTPSGSDSSGDSDSGEDTSGDNDSGNSGGGTYVVKAGDYLTKLAAQFGTTWQQLAAINGINWPYTIYPGQVLKTGGAVPSTEPTPKPTRTPKPDATPEPSNNNNDNESSGGTYTVKAGDHLMKIARSLGLDWTEIATMNGLTAPYILYPGQVLKIPGGGTPQDSPDNGNDDDDQGSGSPQSGETYIVQPGDYLVALARKFGITWTDLAAANGIGWPYVIYPGQSLSIP